MANITLTAQNVNGDPSVNGGTINIVNNATSVLTFVDVDTQLNDPLTGEYVSFDGGATMLSYQYLGVGNVRGDPMQKASFIRIDLGGGNFMTVALDMNADFDDLPDLQNGNTQLTVAGLDTTSPNWFPGFACFVAGTRIVTADGERRIETLAPGDLIRTADRGLQPLLHLARRRVRALGALAPVRFAPGALGNTRPLLVSQQHRMLITGWRAELFCGRDEVFAPAKSLVNGREIAFAPGGVVEYLHLLFAAHELVLSEGAWSESWFPGAVLDEPAHAARDEALTLFPELRDWHGDRVPLARAMATGTETRLLAA